MNKLAEIINERVTNVKFDDDMEIKCPTLTSLFFSTHKKIELLTPRIGLGDPQAALRISVDGELYSNGQGECLRQVRLLND